MLSKVTQHRLIRLPPIRKFHRHTEMHRLRRRMRIQQFGNPGPAHDDARVTVPGCEYAQPAGLEVEGAGVAAAGEGVQDDRHVVLAALESVGGVDGDRFAGRAA